MRMFKNKLAVTIIVLSVTFLALIIYSVKRERGTFLENGIGVALNPVQKVAYTISGEIHDFWDFATNFSKVKSDNEKLKKRNNELESMVIEYGSLKKENERLEDMLNFKSQRKEEYIGAHILGKAPNLSEVYSIDKGSKDGIKAGMVVVTSSGLFGKVAEVNSNWSKIYSLSNENIAVAAMIERTQETTGIVKGYRDANNRLLARVYNLPIDSEVKEGDVVLTSNEGLVYPKGLKIGKVLSVEEDRGKVMKIATIEPYVNFSKLEEIFIVVPKEQVDIKY